MANEPQMPVIISGTHTGEPIGELEGPDGQIISVWSTNPVDLAYAIKSIPPIRFPVPRLKSSTTRPVM